MKTHFTTISSVIGVLWAACAGIGGGEDWNARLATPPPSGIGMWKEAVKMGESEALATAITELEGQALQSNGVFIDRLLPGGDLAGGVSPELQVRMMALLPKASPRVKTAAYRLWRIHQLTPDEGLEAAALDALKTIPEEGLPPAVILADDTAARAGNPIDPAKMARGKAVYMRPAICNTCHQPNGQGISGAFPPLAGSEWMDGDTDRLIKVVLRGLVGEIVVKGEPYNSIMAPLAPWLKDEEIADVLTYVRNAWGNRGTEVTPEQVRALREATKDQILHYQVADILKAHPLKK